MDAGGGLTFPTIVTLQLRVVAPNPNPGAGGNGWGLSEFEVWTPAVFQLRNENSGKLMGVDGSMSTANGANIQQYDDKTARATTCGRRVDRQ
ncbi:hypothetical protein N0V85_001524 [Neurospora sp. IMI 360204]|nr:hypothetical protein N0V85_001524 [Neurospora sp. IMI 360204]